MHPLIRMSALPIILFTINSTPWAQRLMDPATGIMGFDKVMHTLGGIFIAYSFFVFVRTWGLEWWRTLPRYAQFCFIVTVVMAVGVLWEFYEFTHDQLFGTHFQPNNADTMGDLFFDTVGACGAAAMFVWHKCKSRR